jgi:hypothetical protein
MTRNIIPIEKLRRIFEYDPNLGHLKYRIRRGPAKAGSRAGTFNANTGYRIVRTCGMVCLEHRIIWAVVHGEWPPINIDHRDRNKTNNYIDNLRLADYSLNQANRAVKRSGLKGVARLRSGKFQAQVKKDGINFYLGLFETEEEAHKAYCSKARELFGEHARFT